MRTLNSLRQLPLRQLRDLTILITLLLLIALLNAAAQAQTAPPQAPRAQMPAETPVTSALQPLARDSELYCAGYIEQNPGYGGLSLVGGAQEQERSTYAFGDFVYINAGSQAGVKVGQEFTVVRPRGQFQSDLSAKKGSLGVFTQEIGRLRVTDVKGAVSIAQVVHSCDQMLLGDLLKPAEVRSTTPSRGEGGTFYQFADSSGKQHGHIVLARDAREMVSLNQIVYVDLGTEDNVRAGDRLTIFRKTGKGRIVDFPEEITPSASGGFQSWVFKGGKFSNKSQRVKDTKSDPFGPPIETPEIKRTRPEMPRKVVGELVIINVQGRAATAIITRAGQEIHTGDEVEIQ
ncbi:MAG: hypothetical protein LC785_06470 [Acidobacteria bacterium]|nr:hypothetical protein [Acidobacteriota bacterium]MCA1641586.1 hypothetical protein [Acidobacteriota bacterium]